MTDGRAKTTPEQRQSAFTAFISHVEAGERLGEACRLAGYTWGSIGRWLGDPANRDTESGDSFAVRYVRARSLAGVSYADRAQAAAECATPETVQVAKLQADTYKWRAAMADPKGYGDRKQLDLSGSVAHLHLAALQRIPIDAAATLATGAHALPEQIPYTEPIQGE